MIDLKNLADIPCDQMSKKYPMWQAITIGNSIVCDGFVSGKTTAVFSHFHDDHTYNIARTLTGCHNVILTQTTYDALYGMGKIPNRGTFKILSEGKTFHTDYGEKIELIDANHVPGSSQVLVTMEENEDKILYSGDFCYPGITVPHAKVLILESEHGETIYDFDTDKPSILRRIFDQVMCEIENEKPVEIRAHAGTMQDIIAQLEKSVDGNFIPEKVPFLADEIDVNLTNAIKHTYNEEFREVEIATNSRLDELYNEKQPYVRFSRVGKKTPQEDRGIVIQTDVNVGFKKNGPFFTHDNHRYFACTAAHSSFSNVLKYVKAVNPELVLIDGTRASKNTAKELALSINKEFQIPAIPKFCT